MHSEAPILSFLTPPPAPSSPGSVPLLWPRASLAARAPKQGCGAGFPEKGHGDIRDRAPVGGMGLGIKCVRPWGISRLRGGYGTLSPAPGQLHRMSPRWPGTHKIPIQGRQQKAFLQGLPGERAASEPLLGGCSVPCLSLSTLLFTLGKICFLFFWVFLCEENRPPFGQGSFALINGAVMHGHALSHRSQTNAFFFFFYFFNSVIT